MLLRKLKLNKVSVFIFLIICLIFIQVLFIAPQEISSAEQTNKVNHTTESEDKKVSQPEKRKAVEQKMVGVHLVENSNNSKGWELYADEATGSSDELWVLKKVRVEFFNDNNSSYTVSGDIGEINGQSKNMLIRGHVITQSSNKYQFMTDDLNYVADKKQLVSDSVVQMKGPADNRGSGFELSGQGFKIDLTTNKMYIISNIEANKAVDQKKFHITSLAAEFSNRSQEATFLGQVALRFDTTVVTAPQAIFKYSDKIKALESILLKDKVVLKDIGRNAVCQSLLMNLVNDTMTLSGQPKVQMGEDEIRGDEIIFLEGGKKVKINKVKIDSKKQ